MLNPLESLAIQQTFSKPCMVNMMSKDTHPSILYFQELTGISFLPTIAWTHSKAAGELARMLSTLPCRKRLVDALSYVDTRFP